MKENVWEKYSEQDLDEMNVFCEGYKDFISECKTEREVIKFATNLAKKAGFLDLNDVINQKIQPKQLWQLSGRQTELTGRCEAPQCFL